MAFVHGRKSHPVTMYPTKDKFTSTLLAVVLILGQLAFAQHALDLSSHADGEYCELCLLSASLDQVLAQKHHPAANEPTRGLSGNWQDLVTLQTVTPVFLARAPPTESLLA